VSRCCVINVMLSNFIFLPPFRSALFGYRVVDCCSCALTVMFLAFLFSVR